MGYVLYSGFVAQPGLIEALTEGGVGVIEDGANVLVSDLAAAQNIVGAYSPLPYTKQQAEAQVMATRAAKLAAGLAIGSNVVAIDDAAQSEIKSLAVLAIVTISGQTTTAWPTGRTWPVVSGAPIPLTTPQDLIAIGVPAAHYVWSLKDYASGLVKQIMAATTASAVQAINLTSGWPTS